MKRRDFTLGLGALTLAACATGRAPRDDDPLGFAYFTTGKQGEAAGLKLAASDDGFAFRTLAGLHGRHVMEPPLDDLLLNAQRERRMRTKILLDLLL